MKKFNKNSIISIFVVSLLLVLATPIAAQVAGPAAVNLGSAGNFVILSKTGISTTGSTSIVGDIGISPAAATYITGFGLSLPAYGAFSTSSLVSGKVYAPGYADPTPANLTTAVSDMEIAYTDAAGRTNPTATELGAGNIGGMTLAPGLYKWSTGVTIPTDVTLSGSANDVWIFQIAQNLDISSAAKVILSGGAKAGNIFWQVAGQTVIGTTAVFNGNILDQTAIVLNTGATLNGRALAQTAVTLDSNTVIMPGNTATPAVPATPAVSTVSPAVPATSAIPATGNSASTSDRAGLIAQISSQISTLQGQIKAQGSANPNANAVANANANASFNRNLTVGTTGNDVKALQVWLNAHGYAVASSGVGSSGNETTTFGGLTRKALAKFQAKVGISPAAGYFGAITRTYLSTHQ
jgi:hypothetical protein